MPRIANPYYPHQHVKCLIGENNCMCSTGDVIDLPEDAQYVILYPVAGGRSDAKVLASGKVWSKGEGLMELDVWQQRQQVLEEKKKLEAEREEMATRKAKEARERAQTKKEIEKPKKAVEKKSLDLGKKLEL